MDIPKLKFIPFANSSPKNCYLKMNTNCNLMLEATFKLPWKPNETQNKQACVKLFQVCIDASYSILMSAHLCLLVILLNKLRHFFSNFAIVLLLWLPLIPDIETFCLFFLFIIYDTMH